MNLLLEALNRPKEAFARRNNPIAWVFAALTILMVAVFDPMISYLVQTTPRLPPGIPLMLLHTAEGAVTYLALCTAFWLICKLFKSTATLGMFIRSWGISYIPTLLCAVVVSLAETYFYLFWNNSLWGLLLNIVFVGILAWKTILYVLFLHTVAGLTGRRLIGAFFACAPVILLLAWVNAAMGLKTPIL